MSVFLIGVFWAVLAAVGGLVMTVSCDRKTRIAWVVAPALSAYSSGVLIAFCVNGVTA